MHSCPACTVWGYMTVLFAKDSKTFMYRSVDTISVYVSASAYHDGSSGYSKGKPGHDVMVPVAAFDERSIPAHMVQIGAERTQ